MATNTPAPSPAEDPQKLVDLQDSTKQTFFIDELAKSHKLTEPEKKEFTEKYKKAIDDLAKKHEGKKDIVIAEISDILKTFKESLQHEKKDDDDFTEFSSNTPDKDKTDTDTKEVLGSQEIDEHIKQLSDKIEAKLNTPATTPPENPADKSPAAVVSRDLPALDIDANIPDIPEYKNPKQKGGLVEFIINWLGTTGIGGWIRKFIMGYDTMEEMTDTMAAMKNIMSIKKESPISAIINLTHITEYDFRDILRKNPRLDFSNMRNVEAAFLGKHAEDKKLAKYHCIYKGIEDMADKIGKTDSPGYDPMGRFSELLSYSKKPEFAPDYTEEQVDTAVAVDVPQEKTEAEQKAEEEKRKLSELEEAQKADKEATDSTNPDQGKAMDEVKEIKKGARDRIVSALEKTEGKIKNAHQELIIAEQDLEATKKLNAAKGTPENKEKQEKAQKRVQEITDTKTNAYKAKTAITQIASDLWDINGKRDDWAIKEDINAYKSTLAAQKAETEVKIMDNILSEPEPQPSTPEAPKEKLSPFTDKNIIFYNHKFYQWTGTNEFREVHYNVGETEGKRIGRNSWWNNNDIVLNSEDIRKVKVLTFSDAEKLVHDANMEESKFGIKIDDSGYIWVEQENPEGPEFKLPA